MTQLTESGVAKRVPSLADRKIRVLNRRDPVVVPPGTSLADCLRAIQRSGIGDSVLVVDATGHLLGVLTERDIFGRLIEASADELSRPVETVMNASPKQLSLDSTVRDAIVLMETGRYRNVPLVDAHGVVAGVIRQQDLLRYFAETFPEELLNLPPRPHQRMKEPEGA
ncbi:MAG: cyclic nucleotide-binding/CBS domain-containing protein [Acidimicrobiia bacterium]